MTTPNHEKILEDLKQQGLTETYGYQWWMGFGEGYRRSYSDAHREAVEATKRLRMAINAIYGSGEHRACPRKCLICNLMSEVTKYDTWAAGGGNDN